MILTAIYSVLSVGEIWNPVNLFKVDMPEHLKEQQLQEAVKQAVRSLETQGLKVSWPLLTSFVQPRKFSAFRGWGIVPFSGVPLIRESYTLILNGKQTL